MARMLDLIRNSELPSNLMQGAARGSLTVPPQEMIEILVYLALHNKVFGEQARLTLAGWDEKASLAAAADPQTSAEVLGYFVSQENLRTRLLPTLAENPSVDEESLAGLAVSGSRWAVETLLKSQRVMSSTTLLQSLRTNAGLRPVELDEITKKLAALGVDSSVEPDTPEADVADEVLECTLTKYLEVNAAELEAEKDKPFQPMGVGHEPAVAAAVEAGAQTMAEAGSAGADATQGGSAKSGAVATPAAAAAPAVQIRKPSPFAHAERRDSALQRISKLDIKSRIALAMRGSKEDRSILVRDSTKLVALAVLDSPKVSESEVEKFAQQKNVLDSVLRTIPMKRKFAKNYIILRNVVYNPRTPLDASLPLVKSLLIHDLKNLAENKDVSETIRKMAMRLYRQRLEKKG
jgi:hypothetical protein